MLGNGVYNTYGVFIDLEEKLTHQRLATLLVFSVEEGVDGVCRFWRDKGIILFLVLELRRTPGIFKRSLSTGSRDCKVDVSDRWVATTENITRETRNNYHVHLRI